MTGDLYDLFLSYSSRDSHVAQPLRDQLQALGYRVWQDGVQIAPGDDWFANISNGIRCSGTVLFLASVNSYLSDNCRDELRAARQENRRIIALVLDRASQPGYLSFLGQYDHIRYEHGGGHMHELRRVFPPRGEGRSQSPPPPEAPTVDPELVDRLAERLPLLVDRFTQKEQASEVFRVQLAPSRLGGAPGPKGGPVVVWAHGAESEAPEKLCQVLADPFLPRLIEEVSAGHPRPRYKGVSRHDLICPEDDLGQPAGLESKWRKRLANALGGRVPPEIPALSHKLTLSPRCHAFHFAYPATGSPRAWSRLLDAFAAFWADPAWAMPPEARCVVFLSVTYPAGKERTGPVQQAAHRAQRRFPEGRFVLLEPVRAITLFDALQWAKDPVVAAAAGALPGWSPSRIEKAIRSTYGSRKALPMLTLLEELQSVLYPTSNH